MSTDPEPADPPSAPTETDRAAWCCPPWCALDHRQLEADGEQLRVHMNDSTSRLAVRAMQAVFCGDYDDDLSDRQPEISIRPLSIDGERRSLRLDAQQALAFAAILDALNDWETVIRLAEALREQAEVVKAHAGWRPPTPTREEL